MILQSNFSTTGLSLRHARWSLYLMAVSEAIALLLTWKYRLWVMLPVTTEVVLVTSARSPHSVKVYQ